MQILNEIKGLEITVLPDYFFIFIMIFIIGIGLAFGGVTTDSFGTAIFGLFLFILGLILMLTTQPISTGKYEPTQYEVVITDKNFVIDASKYKIVEKRGEIILLEEVKEAK